VILIAMVLGLFAFNRVGNIQKSTDTIALEDLPKVYLVGQVLNNAHANEELLYRHVNSNDKVEKTNFEQQMHANSDKNAAILAEYEKLLRTDKGRELFAEAKRARGDYNSSREDALKLSREGTFEANQKAREAIRTSCEPLFEKVVGTQNDLVAVTKVLADNASTEAQGSVTSARSGILICLGLAVVIAIGIALFIIRSITRPLAIAVQTADRVAKGELPDEVDASSQDELGHMLAALNGMTENLKKAANIAVSISEGDLTVEAQALSEKDVLGQAQKRMLENLKKAVRVAVSISEGDLTVEAKALSEKDVLGQAQNSMIQNLKKAVGIAVSISEGNLAVEATALSEKDVLGQAQKRMLENLRKAAGIAVSISEGDLTVDATDHSEKDVLGQAQKRMLENLRRTVTEVGMPLTIRDTVVFDSPHSPAIFPSEQPSLCSMSTRSRSQTTRGLPPTLPLLRARSSPATVRSLNRTRSCFATVASIEITASLNIPQESRYCSV